jgi:DNA polymerase (family 10)/putative hydrolase
VSSAVLAGPVADLPSEIRRSGDWHMHTDYTDGQSSVDDYCRQATDHGPDLLCFSEHVRQELDYDFDALRWEVEQAREQYPDLTILLGCEAKVLDSEGTLDMSDAVLSQVDVVTGVFHSFPDVGVAEYVEAACALVANPAVDVYGHPTLLPTRRGLDLSPEDWAQVVATAVDHDTAIEVNSRYDLPRAELVAVVQSSDGSVVVGSDAHEVSQLQSTQELQERWEWIDRQY